MSGEHNFEAFAKAYHNEKLAEVAECHKSTIYAYKKGNPIPSDVVIRIADYYKVSTDRVLGRILPAEALTKENFPNARPNVAFTLTQEQLDYEKQNRELKFSNEVLKKENEAIKQQLTEVRANHERHIEDYNKLLVSRNKLADEIQRLTAETGAKVNTPDPSAAITELGRLRAILQSIHFLSEEK